MMFGNIRNIFTFCNAQTATTIIAVYIIDIKKVVGNLKCALSAIKRYIIIV